jgi:uncharacterized membrane protein
MTLEARIARLLTVGSYASVALLAAGVVLLLAAGRSPLEGGPLLEPLRIAGDIAALRPEGFLWLGLVAVIATPAARVVVAVVGFVRGGEREMAVVAALILGVIVLSVALAIGTGA